MLTSLELTLGVLQASVAVALPVEAGEVSPPQATVTFAGQVTTGATWSSVVTVRLDKQAPFLGREALVRQRAEGLTKRLVSFTLDDPAAFPWGGEPILMDGRNVGELTSTGYSRKYGRAIALGYARAGTEEPALTDERILSARYEIDVAGTTFAVTPHLKLA